MRGFILTFVALSFLALPLFAEDSENTDKSTSSETSRDILQRMLNTPVTPSSQTGSDGLSDIVQYAAKLAEENGKVNPPVYAPTPREVMQERLNAPIIIPEPAPPAHQGLSEHTIDAAKRAARTGQGSYPETALPNPEVTRKEIPVRSEFQQMGENLNAFTESRNKGKASKAKPQINGTEVSYAGPSRPEPISSSEFDEFANRVAGKPGRCPYEFLGH